MYVQGNDMSKPLAPGAPEIWLKTR